MGNQDLTNNVNSLHFGGLPTSDRMSITSTVNNFVYDGVRHIAVTDDNYNLNKAVDLGLITDTQADGCKDITVVICGIQYHVVK